MFVRSGIVFLRIWKFAGVDENKFLRLPIVQSDQSAMEPQLYKLNHLFCTYYWLLTLFLESLTTTSIVKDSIVEGHERYGSYACDLSTLDLILKISCATKLLLPLFHLD